MSESPSTVRRALVAATALVLSCRSSAPSAAPRSEAGAPAPVSKVAPADRARGDIRLVRSFGFAGGEHGVGFDDLVFAPQLHDLIVPVGGTGKLALIDPDAMAVSTISIGAVSRFRGGHDDGVTSADSDGTSLFAIDRTARRLLVAHPKTATVQASVPLSGHPDYVRWVGATHELWVTEPDEEQIEVFAWSGTGRPTAAGKIRVAGGPESLVIDASEPRAFTHLWRGVTVAIGLRSRDIESRWSNGCRGSRGIAYDGAAKVVLAACGEGKLVALATERGGMAVSTLEASSGGVDVIAFNPSLRHVYVPAADSGEMTVAGLSEAGELRTMGVVATARGAHCAVADDRGHAWVCDPAAGRVLVFEDALR